ncbi:FtsX-like permease family protein [Marinoscillum sp. MHG1-6]|uniref:ABC transporter permease n=1 Tax=Marinoscillum sp. MHG1-6 TaxID=2959627 RepID=UPI0021573759|nr:FtsX-like permease family protein [Marinoscillum sp. MHG1-6]
MYIILAWRNIWRNKRRSYITIGSIAFAVLLACFMRSMQLGSYERMIENAARFYTGYVQVHQKGYWDEKTIDNSFSFDSGLIDSISRTPGVQEVVPRVESFALASFEQKTKGCLVLGIDPELENRLTQYGEKLVEGAGITPEDKSILISEGLANYLKVSKGDSVVLMGQGYHGATAVGIYPVNGIIKFRSPAQNNQTIYLPLREAQWLYAAQNRLTTLALVIDKAKHVDRVVSQISEKIDPETMEVMGWKMLMPDLVQGIEIDNISGKLMTWILYTVIGFGMFGTFLMMTAERMYEFGVLISVGMKRIQLQVIIFLEMAMMSAIGVGIGVLITLPFLIYYHYHPIYFSGESAEAIEKFGFEAAYFFSLQPSIFYSQAWVILILAMILGLYPLIVLQRLKPVKAMREA